MINSEVRNQYRWVSGKVERRHHYWYCLSSSWLWLANPKMSIVHALALANTCLGAWQLLWNSGLCAGTGFVWSIMHAWEPVPTVFWEPTHHESLQVASTSLACTVHVYEDICTIKERLFWMTPRPTDPWIRMAQVYLSGMVLIMIHNDSMIFTNIIWLCANHLFTMYVSIKKYPKIPNSKSLVYPCWTLTERSVPGWRTASVHTKDQTKLNFM